MGSGQRRAVAVLAVGALLLPAVLMADECEELFSEVENCVESMNLCDCQGDPEELSWTVDCDWVDCFDHIENPPPGWGYEREYCGFFWCWVDEH